MAASVKCANCGAYVNTKTLVCPYCGNDARGHHCSYCVHWWPAEESCGLEGSGEYDGPCAGFEYDDD